MTLSNLLIEIRRLAGLVSGQHSIELIKPACLINSASTGSANMRLSKGVLGGMGVGPGGLRGFLWDFYDV